MEIFSNLFDDSLYRLTLITPLDILDLILVTFVYFGLFLVVRRSRAGFILRAILFAILILLVSSLLLPLPTFDWVLIVMIGGLVVATPIALQPELQRILERIGRYGFRRTKTEYVVENIANPIKRSIASMSKEKTGALLAIEGKESLAPIVATGVPVDGKLTDELLRTLYWDKTPLHDGAVIVQEGRIVAAGCVLPLTDKELVRDRRLGTRHRAAVGLSEVNDALVLVVSEESGKISKAYDGKLTTGLDEKGVQDAIVAFFDGEQENSAETSLDFRDRLRGGLEIFGYFALAAIFALLSWAVVMNRNNPIQLLEVDNVPLRITDIPEDSILQTDIPETVTVRLRTSTNDLENISSDSFLASASLADFDDGLQRVTIDVSSNLNDAELISWTPSFLDFELVPVLTKNIPIKIDVIDLDQLAIGYEAGVPSGEIESAEISGAEQLVEQVMVLKAELSIADATSPISQRLTLVPVDENGDEVTGVQLSESSVLVTMPIRQSFATTTVGVRVVIEGSPPENYTLQRTTSNPTVVTLRGDTDEMAEFNSFISTTPITISYLSSDLTITVPLVLPTGVTALDEDGKPIQSVEVIADIEPIPGTISLVKEVILPEVAGAVPVSIQPEDLRLTVSGPLPLLASIEEYPDLISVRIDISDVPTNVPTEVPLEIFAPDGVTVQTNGIDTVVVFIEITETSAEEEPDT